MLPFIVGHLSVACHLFPFHDIKPASFPISIVVQSHGVFAVVIMLLAPIFVHTLVVTPSLILVLPSSQWWWK